MAQILDAASGGEYTGNENYRKQRLDNLEKLMHQPPGLTGLIKDREDKYVDQNGNMVPACVIFRVAFQRDFQFYGDR